MPVIGIVVLFAGFGAFFVVEENEYGCIPFGIGLIILGIAMVLAGCSGSPPWRARSRAPTKRTRPS